ncbi:MAG: MFS transporter [Nitrospinota bacterium]
MTLATVLNFAAASAVAMSVQLYLEELGAPTLLIGLGSTLFWLATLLASSPWGALSDRFRRRPLLALILAINTLTAAGFAFTLSIGGVLATVFFRSLVTVGFAPIALALISGVSAKRERGKNLSYYNSSQSFGWMLGRIIAGFLLGYLAFRGTYLVLALFPLLALVPLAALREAGDPPGAGVSLGWRGLKRSILPELKSDWVFAQRGLWSLYLGIALRQMGIAGTFALIFVYMLAKLGINPAIIGFITAFNAGTQFLGMLVFGRLADRFGRKRVFMFGFALSALSPLIFALAHGAGLMVLGFIVLGLSFSSLTSGATAFIGDLAPIERQGELLGLFKTSQGFGGILGPLLAGALASPTILGFRGMFLAMAVVISLGFLLALLKTEESLE